MEETRDRQLSDIHAVCSSTRGTVEAFQTAEITSGKLGKRRQKSTGSILASAANTSNTPQYCTLFSLRTISSPLFRLHQAAAPLCHQDGCLLFLGDARGARFSATACSSLTGL
ncbi:unnamed protein product [Pleuronectes platessa]|uniref:Uncharacterized protein n=1 Tax=Pleuronectes platessa TaxID=8262 RepID=A0A9N7UCD1_PLEPL|nr:unnamed protein product [Pleuronectes platessa]